VIRALCPPEILPLFKYHAFYFRTSEDSVIDRCLVSVHDPRNPRSAYKLVLYRFSSQYVKPVIAPVEQLDAIASRLKAAYPSNPCVVETPVITDESFGSSLAQSLITIEKTYKLCPAVVERSLTSLKSLTSASPCCR